MPTWISDLGFALVSMAAGVAGSWGLYWLLDWLLRRLPEKLQEKLRVLTFILPAGVLLLLVSVFPMIQTVIWSFMDDSGKKFVGTENYFELFSSPDFMSILLNNLLWVAFVPVITVGFGLIFATLGNNVGPKREKVFKSLIFFPMAISFVAAATIWLFIYDYAPEGRPQIGLLNAIVESLGGQAQQWMLMDAGRVNSFLIMIIVVWLNAGYSMVLISAGIKAVPEETIEAARVDGAGPFKVFSRIIVPQIWGTIVSVFITTVIGVMKIFDIILVMTGGNFNTSVLAFDFYQQFFVNSALGPASAVVTILCILIAPMMWLQIRTVRHQETLR